MNFVSKLSNGRKKFRSYAGNLQVIMKLPRPGISASALLTMIAALFAVMLALGWSTYLELERQRVNPTDSAQWSIFQTSLEFNRLSTAYADFRVDPRKETRDQFKKRFDIFFSRISILKSSTAFESFRDKEFYLQTTQKLSAFVLQIAALIDHYDDAGLRDNPRVLQEFQEVGKSIAAFVAFAVQTQAEQDVTARNQLKRLLLAQLAVSGLVLLAFLYFAFVVLHQRNAALTREAEITEQKDLLRATVNSSLDGVLIADSRGHIVEMNDAAAKLFGYTPSEMEGQEMSGLIMPQRMRNAHKAGMARFAATGKAKVIGRRVELDAMRRDGTEFPIELSISATGTGSDAKYVAFLRDISERRIVESSLKAAKEKAEAASREKARFLAAISHEMRTPLTGILGALDLISTTDLSVTQRKYVQTADRSGHALLSVISDVLDISRLEANRIELDLGPLDIDGIVSDVLEIIGKLSADRGNIIHVDIDRTIPKHLTGDSARIRQVLLNLVTNAAKFTFNGTIAISISKLASDANHADVEFSVRDTGPGISKDDKGKLFLSFSQINTGAEKHPGGSGLGLAISSRLVTMMSGKIGVDSELGRGSTFWFQLPLAISTEPVLRNDGGEASTLQDSIWKPRSVLVIDDNETVRSIIAGQLATRGHLAETADGAIAGLKMLRSSAFDAVILDISMPGMDGFEALREIRMLPGAASRTPVIALTAHALIEDRVRCLSAGFNQFLTKPVRAAELSDAVERATSAGAAIGSAELNSDGPSNAAALFDLGELREQFVSVEPAALHRIVERFGIELDQQLNFLKAEGREMSPHHFRRIVHVLSGSSSMIGAKRLASLAGQLDAQAAQSEEVGSMASLDELMTTILHTRNAVEAARQTLHAEAQANPS